MSAILLAALAALGLFSLLWLGFGRLLIPAAGIHILVPVHGDGGDLEHNLKGLRWLCATGLLDARIDLLDAGLTDTGREPGWTGCSKPSPVCISMNRTNKSPKAPQMRYLRRFSH